MIGRFTGVVLAVALAGSAALAQTNKPEQTRSPQASPAPSTPRKIDPKADQVLHRMSDYLSGLQSFECRSRTTDEVVLESGQKIQQLADTRLLVQRPNRVRAERLGPVADVVFTYDGRAFSIVGKRTGYYANVAAPPTLDAAIDVLRGKYGLEVPAANLLLTKPYDALTETAKEGVYVGLEPLEGVQTHHLAFSGDEVDWQIWIQDGPEPLPRRFVITSKTIRSAPQFTAELSNWDPKAKHAADAFAFKKPPNGKQIELLAIDGRATKETQQRKGQ